MGLRHEQPAAGLAGADASTVKAGEGIGEPDEAIGQTQGRYKLLERVGEGGCGVVYVAEQTEPVRRRVALNKVIKPGMDTKQVVARFEAERQALAMMDHPNIARVLDAGTTGHGRPYFVMEPVRGIRITDYCDKDRVTTRERLDLFVKVRHAIQPAHQKGIIHRDIKPSNILAALVIGVGLAIAALVREQKVNHRALAAQQNEFGQSVRVNTVKAFIDNLMSDQLPSLVQQGNNRAARELIGLKRMRWPPPTCPMPRRPSSGCAGDWLEHLPPS